MKKAENKTAKELIENPEPKFTVWDFISKLFSFLMGFLFIGIGIGGLVTILILYPTPWDLEKFLLLLAFPTTIYAGYTLIRE